MSKFLRKLANFFTYKEPANKELGFELLEDEIEDQPAPGIIRRRSKPYKTSLSADRWAKSRRAEKTEQSKCDQSTICSDLKSNSETMKNKLHFNENSDVVVREFNIGRKIKAFMIFVENMVDDKLLNLSLLPQLMSNDVFDDDASQTCPVDYLIENVIAMHQVKKTDQYDEAVTIVLSGGIALFVEGCGECITIKTVSLEKRAVEQPVTEPVIKGSHEGLTESMDTNIALIRKIIRNKNLIVKMIPVGSTNHSYCAVMYLNGVANRNVVAEVMKRIKKINADYIPGTGFIEQFIEDNPKMLFPQISNTERPDKAASFIMDGMVTIISDGTPLAIAVPCTFFRLMSTPEDFNLRWPFGTFLRFIRYLGLIISVFLPGMYIALILFHTEMLPTEILVSISTAKEAVPFPALVEVLLLELSFEMVREGAIRVPGVIGQTLGIVGALILGQAAVSANLVNPVTVIIVSLTSIGSFTTPNYELGLAMRVSRFAFILGGAVLGFYGISIVLAIAFLMACSMKSFGVPFFSPVAPKVRSKEDTIIRKPISSQTERSDALNTKDRIRMGRNVTNWTQKQPTDEGSGGS